MKGIRITAKTDGYRRCGLAHSKTPVEHPLDRFTAAELKILKADPGLTVEEVEVVALQEGEAIPPKVGTFEGEIGRPEEELAEERRKNADLARDLAAVRDANERNATEREEAGKKIVVLEGERSTLQQDLTTAREQLQENAATIDSQAQQIARLQQQLEEAKRQLQEKAGGGKKK